jgi:hypothetical protein
MLKSSFQPPLTPPSRCTFGLERETGELVYIFGCTDLCHQSMLSGLDMTSVGVQEAGVVGIEHACSKVLVDIAKEVATSV